ncbi:MAG: enoyl-CoA hydratase/isomerase family protein, partial [Acidimicrobiales bacterium]
MVGGAIARDLLLTGREVDATTALSLNLVSSVVDPADLPAELESVMGRIVAAPRDALLRTKEKAIRRAAIDLRPTLEL